MLHHHHSARLQLIISSRTAVTVSRILGVRTATAALKTAAAAVAEGTRCMSTGSTRQKTLNKFLGLPLQQVQTRVDSLFRRQEKESQRASAQVALFATSSSSNIIMKIDNKNGEGDMAMAQSSDVEVMAASSSKATTNGAGAPLFF
jgi:hypothetical protein